MWIGRMKGFAWGRMRKEGRGVLVWRRIYGLGIRLEYLIRVFHSNMSITLNLYHDGLHWDTQSLG